MSNPLQRLARAALALFGPFLVSSVFAQSAPPAQAPFHKEAAAESLRLAPGSAAVTDLRLAPIDTTLVNSAKSANAKEFEKRLKIGIGRATATQPQSSGSALAWTPVAGGVAAQWRVTSPGAQALRVALVTTKVTPGIQVRFAGKGGTDVVYGPVRAADLNPDAPYWSPVLEGESAIVEVFVPQGESPDAEQLALAEVSHLFVSPSNPKAESLAKATGIGGSGLCEVDLICRSANDPALAQAGKAVARMTFTDGTLSGSTFLCTGTLLNALDGSFIPYFYTANHCINTQASASTLTTDWFFDSTTCGSDNLSPNYVQLTGGATLLYGDATSDGTLLRLHATPPNGAVYSGWDASTLAIGTPLTGIHHPAGDLKKVSLGSMAGFGNIDPSSGLTNEYQVNWNGISTGVTEGGSSGSGIFSASSSGYLLRGGLHGGPSSCTAGASDLHDFYSRLDQIYPSIAQYLNPSGGNTAPNYTALWWNPNESGWGVNVNHQGSILFATLFTYAPNGQPTWYFMSSGNQQSGTQTFSGTLYSATGPIPLQTNHITPVGTMSFTFSDANDGTLSYTVNGITVTKPIQKQVFGTRAAVCQATTADRSSLTNYQDLWWGGQSQSGWGVNITHQDNTLFATLFTYDAGNNPIWFFMSGGTRQSDGSYAGALYMATGPAFYAQPWSSITPTQIGSMSFRFSNGTTGTMTYTVNGSSVSYPITRQVFSSPVPACS